MLLVLNMWDNLIDIFTDWKIAHVKSQREYKMQRNPFIFTKYFPSDILSCTSLAKFTLNMLFAIFLISSML